MQWVWGRSNCVHSFSQDSKKSIDWLDAISREIYQYSIIIWMEKNPVRNKHHEIISHSLPSQGNRNWISLYWESKRNCFLQIWRHSASANNLVSGWSYYFRLFLKHYKASEMKKKRRGIFHISGLILLTSSINNTYRCMMIFAVTWRTAILRIKTLTVFRSFSILG